MIIYQFLGGSSNNVSLDTRLPVCDQLFELDKELNERVELKLEPSIGSSFSENCVFLSYFSLK